MKKNVNEGVLSKIAKTGAVAGAAVVGGVAGVVGLIGSYALYQLIQKMRQRKQKNNKKSSPEVINAYNRANKNNFSDISANEFDTISRDSYYSFMVAVSLRKNRQHVPAQIYESIAKDPFSSFTFAQAFSFKEIPRVIFDSIMNSEYQSKMNKKVTVTNESFNSTLNKLDKAYGIMLEHCGHCENAKQLVEFFNNYGQKFKNSYFNSSFDNDGKNGIVIIKYSKCPMTEKTSNEQLSKAPLNFIITVEGFDADGSVKSPLKVETINYYDSNKKARKIPVTGFEGLKATKDYLISYFEKYDRELMNEDGEGGAGTGTSTAGVAIFAQRMPMGVTRRQWKSDSKKKNK